MKLGEFDEMTGRTLLPLAARDGFALRQGALWRRREPGILDAVILDFDVRQGRTFKVIAGFNADVTAGGALPPECGVMGVKYVGGDGLADSAHRFVCFDKGAAEKSLARVVQAWPTIVHRFNSVGNLQQLADLIEPMYAYHRACLYAAAGAREQAMGAFAAHLAHLDRQPKSEETRGYIETTMKMMEDLR